MKLNQIFLLFLGLFWGLSSQAHNCAASRYSCDFYQCMEQNQPCGAKGYWQDFGTHYCELFVRDEKKFSPASQVWLQNVRECLQVHLGELSESLTCSQIKDEALNSHVACYVQTGFCELSMTEQFSIFWYLRGALRDLRTWKEAELLRQACNKHNKG